MLSSLEELRGLIAERRSDMETLRKLPDPVVEALIDLQLPRMYLPKAIGGLEIDPIEALQVIESLARADAAVAWVVWNNGLPCLFARYLGEEARREIFEPPAFFYASSTRPTGKAVVEPGGYKVSGRWSLVSGCLHADWLAFMCVEEKDGHMVMTPAETPQLRLVFVPAASCAIIDTWHAGGLRGSGSHDCVLEEVYVPAEKSFTPMDPMQIDSRLGRVPISSAMAAGHAAICLGIAQSALDTVIELGKTKVSVDGVPGLVDRASNQQIIAETTTKIAAFRAHLMQKIAQLWAMAEEGPDRDPGVIGGVWRASVTSSRECRNMVSDLYEVAGSPSLYEKCLLERCHRDIHAAMQHIISQKLWLEESGKVCFGLAPENPLFML